MLHSSYTWHAAEGWASVSPQVKPVCCQRIGAISTVSYEFGFMFYQVRGFAVSTQKSLFPAMTTCLGL